MKFLRSEDEDFSMQMTPLIDVVFLLLIFFMVSTAFIDFTRQVDIELPETKAGAPVQKTKIVEIEMTLDGALLLDGEAIDIESLAALLEQKDATIKKRSAMVRADRRLDFGKVVKVMGICRQAGILDIGIAVE